MFGSSTHPPAPKDAAGGHSRRIRRDQGCLNESRDVLAILPDVPLFETIRSRVHVHIPSTHLSTVKKSWVSGGSGRGWDPT